MWSAPRSFSPHTPARYLLIPFLPPGGQLLPVSCELIRRVTLFPVYFAGGYPLHWFFCLWRVSTYAASIIFFIARPFLPSGCLPFFTEVLHRSFSCRLFEIPWTLYVSSLGFLIDRTSFYFFRDAFLLDLNLLFVSLCPEQATPLYCVGLLFDRFFTTTSLPPPPLLDFSSMLPKRSFPW